MHQKNYSYTKKERCSLCGISQQALEKLTLKTKPQKKGYGRRLMIVSSVVFIVLLFWIIYRFFLTSSQEKGDPVLERNSNFSLANDSSSLEVALPERGGDDQGSGMVLSAEEKPQIGFRAPLFSAQDIEGNEVRLVNFRQLKPVLLVFWATWCGFCAQEKEDLKEFTKEYQDKIQVLVVASGEEKQTIKEYIEREEINFLMLLDEEREIWNQYLVRGTPSHFLINQEGKIITLRPGLASLQDLETMVKLLKL